MSVLRAGVIGFGYTGQLHAKAYEKCGIRVSAVAEPRPGVLATVPAGIQRFSDHHDLLASDLDIVSICTPTALHCAATIEALASGKHVLLEKPIATTVEEAERMIEAERQSGKRLLVGMTHRFYPEIREAKRLVDEGGIGEIVMVRDCILEHFGFVNSPRWYLIPESAGGGTVLSSGVHLVDRVMWFLGKQPVSVSGYAGNPFLGQPIEDAAQMSLGFADGRSAQNTFGLLPELHPLVCDLELIGTRGSIIVHTWQGYELRSASGTSYHASYTSEAHPEKVLVGMCAEVTELCQAIHEGRTPNPSAEESTRPLRVIAAFYEAVATGTIQRLP
jgi:predicted dehydrogenase